MAAMAGRLIDAAIGRGPAMYTCERMKLVVAYRSAVCRNTMIVQTCLPS